MARRRMFSSAIVLSDAFLDMPASARCLYFTLGMVADDDGFVNNPRSVMRQVGATDDDARILLAKRFILGFESGVICIKHWKINNTIQRDRYTPTTYVEEKDTLTLDEKGAYTEKDGMYTHCIQNGNTDKTRLDKTRLDDCHPSLGDIELFVANQGLTVSAYGFWKTMQERDWVIDNKPVRNWKALITSWDKARKEHANDLDEMVMAALRQMEM